MTTPEGARLAQKIRGRVEEFKKICAGMGEDTAMRAPVDRWSPKQVVSHLCGPEGAHPAAEGITLGRISDPGRMG